MNGEFAADRRRAWTASRTLAAIAAGRGTHGRARSSGCSWSRCRASRPPRRRSGSPTFVEPAARQDRKAALADVFWVLLNSTEFALNH